jgi:peroxiredoxin Q/BCP
MMRRNIFIIIWMTNAFLLSSAHALLDVGVSAPAFSTDAALAGNVLTFELTAALKKGPVVLYFYPKAFTSGCTVEAHLFAEASDEFARYNTTVIGISNDTIDILKKFSVEECRNKFSVGADPDGKIIKAYDARLFFGINTSKRVSYVITPDGKIYYVFSSMSPDDHVKKTLEAVKAWKKSQP